MAHESESGTARSPETIDRMMVGICGAIWLVLLAASVFAIVALVRLGSGHPGGTESGSSWLLYSVIVVSAVVILAAIPLLLRARRTALNGPALAEEPPEATQPAIEEPTEKVRVFGVDPYARREPNAKSVAARASHALVDRAFLRGTTSLFGAMGLALTAVAVGTYLLADASDEAAYVALGLAGVLTVAMPVILVFFGRQLPAAAAPEAPAAGE
jgi:FtsH-binding integral membrane protein